MRQHRYGLSDSSVGIWKSKEFRRLFWDRLVAEDFQLTPLGRAIAAVYHHQDAHSAGYHQLRLRNFLPSSRHGLPLIDSIIRLLLLRATATIPLGIPFASTGTTIIFISEGISAWKHRCGPVLPL
ncbi:hypothetical protein Aduo_017524 [Ancylostoma duodenale]